MLRLLQDILRRPLLDEMSGVHDEDAIREVAGARDVVGDVEERHALVLAQLTHQIQDADADRDIEHRDGLVGDDQLRPQRECLGETDPLPLATAELVREAPTRVADRHEPHRLEHPVQLGLPLGPRQVAPVEL